MTNKELTKSDIVSSDILYGIFTIIAAFCFIAIAVVDALIFVCCCIYLVKSFSLAETGLALTLTLLCLLCVVLFAWCDVMIFKAVKKTITRYLKERKEFMSKTQDKK